MDKSKSNLLLINPWIYDFSAYDLWMKPLGLLVIANWLKPFFNVHLIDCMDRKDPELANFLSPAMLSNIKDRKYRTGKFPYRILEKPPVYSWVPRKYKQYGIPEELFIEKLRRIGRVDAVGITCVMTYWYPGVQRAIEIVKTELGDIPIILGGIYARLCRDHAIKFSGADIVSDAWQEADVVREFCNIVQSPLPQEYPEDSSRGLVPRDSPSDGEVFTSSLMPDYSFYSNLATTATVAQLGCPFNCTYCASPLLYSKMVFRPSSEIAAELLHYSETGIRDVALYDDALLVGFKKHLEPVLDELISRGSPVNLHTPNAIHAREVTIDVAKKMRQAGFATIRIGLETVNRNIQTQSSNNKVSNEEFKECIRNLSSAGFDMDDVGCYIMAGLPEQGTGEIIETMKFVYENKVGIYVSMFSPIPGTQEYRRCVEGFGLDPREPLLTNKTIYGGIGGEKRYFELEKARRLAVEMNRSLHSKSAPLI